MIPDYTKIGEITIVVFKDGKCPARVEGINEPLLIKVLAGQIFKVADEVEKQGERCHLGADELKAILKYISEEIAKVRAQVKDAIMLKHLSGEINRIADDLSRKLKEEHPLILAPDLTGGKYS
jgi:hypothetical protein